MARRTYQIARRFSVLNAVRSLISRCWAAHSRIVNMSAFFYRRTKYRLGRADGKLRGPILWLGDLRKSKRRRGI